MMNLLRTCLYSRVPVLLWGSPGIGKTATVYDVVTNQMRRKCWTLIASYREPADFGGLPVIRRETIKVDGTEFTMVELAPPRYAVEAASAPEGGVIFIDEITCTPPAVQAPLLRMVNELVVGELKLPSDRVAVIAAANPPAEAAGGWELSPPLANRFCHLMFKLNRMEWVEDFATYWGAPPVLSLWGSTIKEESWSKARVLVSAFIRAKPSLLHEFPKDATSQGQSWPSPRTWDHVSRLVAVANDHGLAKEERAELVTGSVGPGSAQEFLAWADALDLPDPEDLLANPDSVKLPARGDRQFAVLASVANAVISKNNPDRWKRGWKVMVSAANNYAADIAAATARMLAKNRPPKGAIIPPEADACFRPMLAAAGLLPKS